MRSVCGCRLRRLYIRMALDHLTFLEGYFDKCTVKCAAVEHPLIRVRSSTPSEVIPVGSQEQMRETDWPVLRMWSFFDPAFPVGKVGVAEKQLSRRV